MLVQKRATGYTVHAPAKLNLFFEVRQRRDDGFHEIETLMVPVSLFDTLHLRSRSRQSEETTAGPIQFSCRNVYVGADSEDPHRLVPSDSSNLVVRAVELLRERAGVEASAEIELIKRIPAAGGLGGGSSDAAAALLAANAAWDLNWSRSRLAELSAELGSDIPFFFGHGAAVCRGRGEVIEPLAGLGDQHAVIIAPSIGLSTAEVYSRVEVPAQPQEVGPYIESLRGSVRAGKSASDDRPRLYNALQQAAEGITPWIDRLRSEMNQTGCRDHQLTGSGSSYFGLFRHARQARRAARQLQARELGRVFVVRTAA